MVSQNSFLLSCLGSISSLGLFHTPDLLGSVLPFLQLLP
uniref:Uncharacterized protein n=1 Tax=Lotus japonicus TaxID=34305 RepID=I3S481_LOTJA|nr:unknown [Lotus japonicus]